MLLVQVPECRGFWHDEVFADEFGGESWPCDKMVVANGVEEAALGGAKTSAMHECNECFRISSSNGEHSGSVRRWGWWKQPQS